MSDPSTEMTSIDAQMTFVDTEIISVGAQTIFVDTEAISVVAEIIFIDAKPNSFVTRTTSIDTEIVSVDSKIACAASDYGVRNFTSLGDGFFLDLRERP
jgi:hypothetical protein